MEGTNHRSQLYDCTTDATVVLRLFAGFRDPRLEFGDRVSLPWPASELGHFESLTQPGDQVGSSLSWPDPIPAGIANAARIFPSLVSSSAPVPSAMRSAVGGLSDQVTVEQMSRRQLNLEYRHLLQLLATTEAHRQALVVLAKDSDLTQESSLLRLSRELEQRDVQITMLENELIDMTGFREELNQALMDRSKREEEVGREMEEKTRELQKEIRQLKEMNLRLSRELEQRDVQIAMLENELIARKQDMTGLREELNQALKREEEVGREMEEKTRELQKEIRQLKEMNLSLQKQKSTMRKQTTSRHDFEPGSDDANPSTSSLAPEDSSGFVSCGNLSDVDVGQLGKETGMDDREAHYGLRLHEENRKLRSELDKMNSRYHQLERKCWELEEKQDVAKKSVGTTNTNNPG